MKKLLIAVCSLLSISLLGGCSVRELPEDGGVDPTIVHTEIVLLPGADMTPFDVPEFSTRAADPREYKVRYIVEVYADDKFDQSLQFRRQLICDEGDTEDVTLECDLHARNYRTVQGGNYIDMESFPTPPEHDGLVFGAWDFFDTDKMITSDIMIRALYSDPGVQTAVVRLTDESGGLYQNPNGADETEESG